MKNYFITFEGGEGSGKSTQIDLLNSFLTLKGVDVLCTREPGGTPSAEVIRDLVIKGDTNRWLPMTESLLMWAARYEHVEALIKPSLNAGKWVICDRFYHSTYAYQGVGHDLGLESMKSIKRLVIGDIRPDLVFLLDIDPIKGIKRTKNRSSNEDRFENMDLTFHSDLRDAFLMLSKEEADRFVVIDAELDIREISKIISEEVLNRFTF